MLPINTFASSLYWSKKIQPLSDDSEAPGSGDGGGGSSSSSSGGGNPYAYSKTCTYVWDSTSYLDQEVKIIAQITDQEGGSANYDVDVEVAEIAEDIVRWIVKKDKKHLINLHKVHKMLLFDDNAELFQEKLKALRTLIMPYKM